MVPAAAAACTCLGVQMVGVHSLQMVHRMRARSHGSLKSGKKVILAVICLMMAWISCIM
jgi:hypothetical protein